MFDPRCAAAQHIHEAKHAREKANPVQKKTAATTSNVTKKPKKENKPKQQKVLKVEVSYMLRIYI